MINLYKDSLTCLGNGGRGCECDKAKALVILNKYVDRDSFFQSFLTARLVANWDQPFNTYAYGPKLLD